MTTATTIILETERLLLRRQQAADITPLVELWTDPEVTHHLGGPRDRDLLQTAFEETAQNPWAETYDLWPVIEKATGRVVGHCGLLDKEVEGSLEIELNYIMAPAVWGNGYATEIAAALIDYAVARLGLTRLIALIKPENTASERVAVRVGLQFEKEVVRSGGAVYKLYSLSRAEE